MSIFSKEEKRDYSLRGFIGKAFHSGEKFSRHEGGFLFLPLAEGLEIHIWPEDHDPKQSKIHTHNYSFKSMILTGEVKHVGYKFHIDKKDGPLMVLRTFREGGVRIESPTRFYGSVEEDEIGNLKPGHYHGFERGRLHQAITAPGKVTATLVSKAYSGALRRSLVLRPRNEDYAAAAARDNSQELRILGLKNLEKVFNSISEEAAYDADAYLNSYIKALEKENMTESASKT